MKKDQMLPAHRCDPVVTANFLLSAFIRVHLRFKNPK